MSDLYSLSQDALDAATKIPYELSPQDMVDKLIDGFYLMTAEPTDRICTYHGGLSHAGATACEGGPEPSFHWWDDCVMVDVVRIET